MKVILSGYNVDTDRLSEYRRRAAEIEKSLRDQKIENEDLTTFLKEFSDSKDLTPETFSAAYARISRDPRPVNELRGDAASEVEKSRKSNETIIFRMGHSSVAEHAVMNLDIIDISRLATEELQKTRLASYTEKSQRYISLTDDYTVPDEIKEAGFSSDFNDVVSGLFSAYHILYDGLLPMMLKKHHDLASNKKGRITIEGWAKEDARYIVPLATHTQMGMTANARVLEMTIRRLAKSPVKEIRELAKSIYDAAYPHAPSVIKYTKPTPYDTDTEKLIKKNIKAGDTENKDIAPIDKSGRIKLIDYTEGGDASLAASLFFTHTGLDYESIKRSVAGFSDDDMKRFISTSFAFMESYDRAMREFELITLTFEAVISASCFAQLKRHRMATILTQDYDLSIGIEVPPSIKEAKLEGEFTDAAKISEDFFSKLKEKIPHVAPYILTNAHRRRVLIHLNLRELYHMSRIRMDETAQWDIRLLTSEMADLAKEVLPIGSLLLSSKDMFHDVKKDKISIPT